MGRRKHTIPTHKGEDEWGLRNWKSFLSKSKSNKEKDICLWGGVG